MHRMQRRLAASCGGNGPGNGFFKSVLRSDHSMDPPGELNISLPLKVCLSRCLFPFPVLVEYVIVRSLKKKHFLGGCSQEAA